MAGLREMVISGLLIGLFIIAIIGFGVTISTDNNANLSILQDEGINESYQDLITELETSQDTAEGIRGSFFGQIPVLAEVGILLGYIFGTIKQVYALITGLFGLYLGLIQSALGIPPVITTVLTSILVLSMILLMWRVYRAGQ